MGEPQAVVDKSLWAAIISGVFMLFSGSGFIATIWKLRADTKRREADTFGMYMEKGAKEIMQGFKELAEENGRRADKFERELESLWEQHKDTKKKLQKIADDESDCQKSKQELEWKIERLEKKIDEITQTLTIRKEIIDPQKENGSDKTYKLFQAPEKK